MPHRTRPSLSGREPVHVTWRIVDGLPSLRGPRCRELVRRLLGARPPCAGFAVVEWTIQRDHIHLVVEARDRASCSRGLRRLGIRLARRLNARLGRRGRLIADRYHAHVLRSLREVVHAVRYVRENARHHALLARAPPWVPPPRWMDPCSSAGAGSAATARTWLLRRALSALADAAA